MKPAPWSAWGGAAGSVRPVLRAMGLAVLFGTGAMAVSAATAPPMAQPVAAQGGTMLRASTDSMATASSEARHVARWVQHSGDNGNRPYLIIDKVNATVFAFSAAGKLLDAKPALLGIARGDDTATGIGDRSLASIRLADRTTPAGRFIASLDRDPKGAEVLWIDYASALALHAVVKGQPAERRAQRLESANSQDNRISFGCINVPVDFYDKVVSALFTGTDGLVYILPETSTAQAVFGSYEVDANGRAGTAAALRR